MQAIKKRETLVDVIGNNLYLLIKNTEPLCIPKTGFAGNIIRSESYIPGKMLFTAIVAGTGKQGKDLKPFFIEGVSISNAYPIPDNWQGEDCRPEKIKSMPMPQHYHSIKAKQESEENTTFLPHWAADDQKNPVELNRTATIDIFSPGSSEEKPAAKRPKGEQYLCCDHAGTWHKYIQPLDIRMRNRRGDPDKIIRKEATELFSEQRIHEETAFIAEINFTDDLPAQAKKAWLTSLKNWQEGLSIKIGRGSAPVKLCLTSKPDPSTPGDMPEQHTAPEATKLTLIFTSDWIVRGENLGYLQELGRSTLLRLFNCEMLSPTMSCTGGSHPTIAQDHEEQGAYNYASGMPKRPCNVIKRGSSYQFQGDPGTIAKLRQQIEKQIAWGERTRDGYGRYILNIDALQAAVEVG